MIWLSEAFINNLNFLAEAEIIIYDKNDSVFAMSRKFGFPVKVFFTREEVEDVLFYLDRKYDGTKYWPAHCLEVAANRLRLFAVINYLKELLTEEQLKEQEE